MEKGLPSERDRKRPTPEQEIRNIVRMALEVPNYVHDHRGFAIRWGGWRMPIDGFAEFGVWMAHKTDLHGYVFASTAGPVGQRFSVIEPFDRGAGRIFNSNEERLNFAVEAFKNLVNEIDAVLDRQHRRDV